MKRLAGDSPLKVVIVALLVIFFVALFVWQIQNYLKASQDSKLQAQMTKLSLIIETDNLDTSTNSRFAYAHSDYDIAKPLEINSRNLKRGITFKPHNTLTSLFVRNHFAPSSARHNSCYIYLYFPPQAAQKQFEFYTSTEPAYLLAGWSEHQEKPVGTGDYRLVKWAQNTLTKEQFYCNKEQLRPNKPAQLADGMVLDLPGVNYQFSGLYYSKVMYNELKRLNN